PFFPVLLVISSYQIFVDFSPELYIKNLLRKRKKSRYNIKLLLILLFATPTVRKTTSYKQANKKKRENKIFSRILLRNVGLFVLPSREIHSLKYPQLLNNKSDEGY
ncbi:MAG: hypothetical protein WCT05_15270, partial [Lentisphaeria bacterium]